jgi:hypothetical protein
MAEVIKNGVKEPGFIIGSGYDGECRTAERTCKLWCCDLPVSELVEPARCEKIFSPAMIVLYIIVNFFKAVFGLRPYAGRMKEGLDLVMGAQWLDSCDLVVRQFDSVQPLSECECHIKTKGSLFGAPFKYFEVREYSRHILRYGPFSLPRRFRVLRFYAHFRRILRFGGVMFLPWMSNNVPSSGLHLFAGDRTKLADWGGGLG